MKPNVFMSYSRREVSFVNYLVDDLEDDGFNVWLDYHSLIPGTPWAEQIDQGLQKADVILLVVSKSAITSQYVEMEWRRVLNEDKRVILAIFEAVDLPSELKAFEWVDFRGSYKKGLEELIRQLQTPEVEEHPAPETGFKVPLLVWVAAILSIFIALFSLGAIWTLFIPFLLVPLPYHIFKRDFNFTQVQIALIMLPLALYLTGDFAESDFIWNIADYMQWGSIPFVIALLLILRTPSLQRWGKPVATLPKFANPIEPNNPNPEPIAFFIDYAPEDRATARDLAQNLQEYRHPQVDEPGSAQAVFTLISRYKTTSMTDPEKQVVYPVILQTSDKISPELSKIQWIDFRHGVRNLSSIAQLLPEPRNLLKALGIRPMGNQLILPPTIMYWLYFIIFLAIIIIGSWLPYLIQLFPFIIQTSETWGPTLLLILNLVIFAVIIAFMARAIVQRKGFLAAPIPFLLVIVLLGVLIFLQTELDLSIWSPIFEYYADAPGGLSADYPAYIFGIGNALMLVVSLWKRDDLRRWFPAKAIKV